MKHRGSAVVATSLRFGYDGTTVLDGVSMRLRAGEVTAIVGANGAGKSTLVELLAGVLRPHAGTVWRTDRVALVVQRPDAPDALPLTVTDAVAMGLWSQGPRMGARARDDARRNVVEAIERVGLAGRERFLLSELSGGQRQRTLLAQGIVRHPWILLLDEPAAGLDAESRARTRAILAVEAGRGAAVACVTHDEEAITAADRVIRLEHGRIAAG
ncbi:metal ABC transporter ATP-binding protein [Microbacterium azadirachtae]|uniref:Zinc/manganese transport system ATP-binding protein n=1 Tax=Microbacterium azadirachtae TaxID=582680 RepID=A0A1I6G6W9_9MICO|nr:ATP-binding cassette domain-containing protein [Microbacterium azadirachtae]SDL36148.1 zinc/manganese transport system ATP-binding protein [Microbacterium azadirachtae]SEF66884.1 zinc/manganese transport system ATP-binding protein [Microbacterium azadirachtae]SEF67628.1 zinc/manganese transport system ATP-binding protein [Microbacterium azadirachtae]SFR37943.1 zinc/manganese transport system ATP-binding protein [Microbacterium azadirachtae]